MEKIIFIFIMVMFICLAVESVGIASISKHGKSVNAKMFNCTAMQEGNNSILEKSNSEIGNENIAEEYGTDIDNSDMELEEQDNVAVKVRENSNNQLWDNIKEKQQAEDGEYSLTLDKEEMSIGGIANGEHSFQMGESTSTGIDDGVYDIGTQKNSKIKKTGRIRSLNI